MNIQCVAKVARLFMTPRFVNGLSINRWQTVKHLMERHKNASFLQPNFLE